ncbi:MAG: S41 family peptidase [Verrucomicrobiota bacterium]
MKLIALIFIALVSMPAFSADSPEAAAKKSSKTNAKVKNIIDQMPQNSLQEAFRHLQKDYIKKETLTYEELNRAALQGLLERLDFGATLLTQSSRAERNSPFHFLAQEITREAAYIRPGNYSIPEVAKLDQAIKTFNGKPELHTLILDLRSPQAQADFEVAAQFLSRFLPADRLLFKNKQPEQKRPHLFFSKKAPQRWGRNLVLLIDRETGNVGEIIAAVLKQRTGCLIIGEKTPGLTVEYRDLPLGENRILRYAIAEIVLDDDTSLFQKGVLPDLSSAFDKKSKYAVYKKSEKAQLKTFIFENQRPRLNEAALVAGTDPELDYYLDRTAGRATSYDKKPLQDRPLQQAIDYLTTTQFLHSSKKP